MSCAITIPLFEPAMQPDGALAEIFGGLFGSGPGVGMALLMALCGLLGAGSGLVGYLIPVVRSVEDILPDHDQLVKAKVSKSFA